MSRALNGCLHNRAFHRARPGRSATGLGGDVTLSLWEQEYMHHQQNSVFWAEFLSSH